MISGVAGATQDMHVRAEIIRDGRSEGVGVRRSILPVCTRTVHAGTTGTWRECRPIRLGRVFSYFFRTAQTPGKYPFGHSFIFSDGNNQYVLNVGLRARGAVPRNIFLQPATEQPHRIFPIFVILPVFSIDRFDLE